MEELKMSIVQTQGKISTNLEELELKVVSIADAYKGLEVTEKNKTERKKDIATLRKIMKVMNDEKINVKNEFMKPYIDFETNVKNLIEIINNVVTPLDSSIKEYEEMQLLQKKEEISEFYSDFELSEIVPLNRIYNDKWNLTSTSMNSIKNEIITKLSEIGQAIEAIKNMKSEKEEDAIEMYLDNLKLIEVLNFVNKYEQQKKEIQAKYEEQRKKEQEEQLEKERIRIREEERKLIKEEQKIKEQSFNDGQAHVINKMSIQEMNKELGEPKRNNVFMVKATLEETEQICMYLDSLGLEYELDL